MEISLIGLTESFHTLNQKPCFKHRILETILYMLFSLYLCGTKSFVLKTDLYLFTFSFGLGGKQMKLQHFTLCNIITKTLQVIMKLKKTLIALTMEYSSKKLPLLIILYNLSLCSTNNYFQGCVNSTSQGCQNPD